ncbi:MAG: putative hydrolase of the HAD superfamily [Microgenomates group bacterium Gr01-1014_16]|nr:MAG: putative hydrolase of the HAD superfamily [Microgenomates group bacterium Gr01-1014_16]
MISFVYFDVGGVVILDFSGTDKWEVVKKEWGITDAYWDDFEPKLCAGKEKISPEFLNAFVSRFEPNPSIYSDINEIHTKNRIGLLTNMYPGMFDAIKKSGLVPEVDWNVIIDSSVVGLAKPDPKIFKLAEQKAGVKGNEILFIENTSRHIEAAKSFGWQTFLYDPVHPEESSQKLLDLFLTLV